VRNTLIPSYTEYRDTEKESELREKGRAQMTGERHEEQRDGEKESESEARKAQTSENSEKRLARIPKTCRTEHINEQNRQHNKIKAFARDYSQQSTVHNPQSKAHRTHNTAHRTQNNPHQSRTTREEQFTPRDPRVAGAMQQVQQVFPRQTRAPHTHTHTLLQHTHTHTHTHTNTPTRWRLYDHELEG
jgi:hypothetical protein